jgi:hypothetical protein
VVPSCHQGIHLIYHTIGGIVIYVTTALVFSFTSIPTSTYYKTTYKCVDQVTDCDKYIYSRSLFIQQLIYRQGRSSGYFHKAHCNSRMALVAYFCHYPASHGISRAVSKVSESSTGSAAHTDQLTQRPHLVFIIAHIKIAYHRLLFSPTADSICRHTPFTKCAR